MEEDSENSVVSTTDRTNLEDAPVSDGWVSPDVQAAQAGERVEMGKELPSNEELNEINNA